MYTVTWWVEGAPKERIGGPWWARECDTITEAREFIDSAKEFCCQICLHEGEIIRNGGEEVRPPELHNRLPLWEGGSVCLSSESTQATS